MRRAIVAVGIGVLMLCADIGVQEIVRDMQGQREEYAGLVRDHQARYGELLRTVKAYHAQFVSKKWGEANLKFSDVKTFTQYADDFNSRQSVDFERGAVTLEVLLDGDAIPAVEAFEKALETLRAQTYEETLLKDPVNRTLRTEMEKAGRKAPKSAQGEEAYLDGLIPKTAIKPGDIRQKRVTLKSGANKKIASVEVAMTPDHLAKLARRFKPLVDAAAERFGLPRSYLYATIHTESYFNPWAKSHVPAFGLMQIVPSTGGMDAYAALYGEKKLLAAEYLFDPKNNIELGAQYIDIISTRYLKGVTNPESLLYCTATAYNAGIGSLFRSLTGSKRKRTEAIARINAMTPDEVYEHLRTSPRLVEEAHNYVRKIRRHRRHYLSWDV